MRFLAKGALGACIAAAAAFVGPAAALAAVSSSSHIGPSPSASSASASGADSYVSAPSLHPPRLSVKVDRLANGGNLLLLDPFANSAAPPAGEAGPLIVENDGSPVWFHPLPAGEQALDFTTQNYAGKPVLSWWQGEAARSGLASLAAGSPQPGARYHVLDQRYRQVATVQAQEGFTADPDELALTARGTALLIASKTVPMDLAPYGGAANGEVLDSEVQEISLKTGRLLFKWNMLEHVPLSQSETVPPLTGAWDPYELDSVQELAGGRLLVSARNTWTVYELEAGSGKILWQLGGNDSSFQLAPQASFHWQSDARLQHGDELTLFDDGCCEVTASGLGPAQEAARGLTLALNTSAHSATLVHQYRHAPDLHSAGLGSLQTLPNGNALVGWGGLPELSEYTSSGKLVYAASLPAADGSDRAVRSTWSGLPTTKPSVVATHRGGRTTVYVSWNGANLVRYWQVFAGPTTTSLQTEINVGEIISFALPGGFQTAIPVSVGGPLFEVEALGANNHVLAVSAPVRAVNE
jgi:Arylsulfotransferase (ASST)